MITLRFSRPKQAQHRKVKISFDKLEQILVAVESQVNWENKQAVSKQTRLLTGRGAVYASEVSSSLKVAYLITEYTNFQNRMSKAYEKRFIFESASLQNNSIQLNLTVKRATCIRQEFGLEQSIYNPLMYSVTLSFCGMELQNQFFNSPVTNALSLKINSELYWGPSNAKYICTWPYIQDKKIKLRFSEPKLNTLSIRFKTPKICYLGITGGLIRSDDDIPTIDRKVPIEPQIQSSYIMTPTIKCSRIKDNLDISISSFSYSFSRGQFAASGNLRFASRIDMERAIGQTLMVTVNGYEFVMLCEQPRTRLKFADKSYSASLRSRFAELSAPYIRESNYSNKVTKTLEGLMTEVLANTGWKVQSHLLDYPVPSNTFSYQGLTPAGALLQIANSVGAILIFDDKARNVEVLPEWPVNPWDTSNATCDVIINDSLIIEHSTRETINQESNAVFIRGEQSGVSCKIKRAGTAGNVFAPDVVDSLITDVQAARQRGVCELARSGNKKISNIRTKLLPTLPPFKPGMLVGIRYTDSLYKATCESVSISASVNEQGMVSVNQDIEVVSNV